MSKLNDRQGICGPDCRYRALYEGSQTSLSDMAHRQAQALARVGRLRNGMIMSLRRNFSRSFQEAESTLGHRLSEVDDEILMTYLGAIMSAAPVAAAAAPSGIEELRTALQGMGIQMPLGTDLASWAEAIQAQKASASVASDELSRIFGVGTEDYLTPPSAMPPVKVEAAKEEAPRKRPRRTLQALSKESKALESTMPTNRDDLASVFNFSAQEPPADYEDLDFPAPSLNDVYIDFDIPPVDPPQDEEFSLPPSDPYSPVDLAAEPLPFPMAGLGAPEPVSNEAADDLASLFDSIEEPAQETPPAPAPPISKSAARRRKKNLREARPLPSVPEPEAVVPPVLASNPEVTRAPWATSEVEINLKDLSGERQVNIPEEVHPEVNLPKEASLRDPRPQVGLPDASPFATVPEPRPAVVEIPDPPKPEEEPLKLLATPLRPELMPLMQKPARTRRTANKSVRTQAAPPDAKLFDVPSEARSEPGATLDDETRNAILAAVCIPRPIFTSDLVAVAGSQELVEAWEAESRASSTSPVRFVAAKTRHRLRGSLVLPIDFLREAATEFKRSSWAECMDRYRGATLYEIAVLLHKIESEVVSSRATEHTLTLRLTTRSGLVGVVVALGPKLGQGELTRNALAAELESLLSERLSLIAVLTPRAEAFDAVCNAVTEEAKTRKWAPAVPVIASRSWEYAEDRGAASQLLMGA